MKVFLILISLMLTLSAYSSNSLRSIVYDLAPSSVEEHYELISDGKFDEIKLDCSSFINSISFKQNQSWRSFFLFHEECFYLAEKAYDAGLDGKAFCLEVDQQKPPFQIFNDLKYCED